MRTYVTFNPKSLSTTIEQNGLIVNESFAEFNVYKACPLFEMLMRSDLKELNPFKKNARNIVKTLQRKTGVVHIKARGFAKADPSDTHNVKKGVLIANTKMQRNAYRKASQILLDINKLIETYFIKKCTSVSFNLQYLTSESDIHVNKLDERLH